jgi:hypothetical protein
MNALKALVIGMGILILAGFAVVAVTMTNRFGSSGGFGDVALDVPSNCTFAQSAPDRGRIIVRLSGGGACEQVLVIDAGTGKVVGRLRIGPAQ